LALNKGSVDIKNSSMAVSKTTGGLFGKGFSFFDKSMAFFEKVHTFWKRSSGCR
jgi:hypothetical protein